MDKQSKLKRHQFQSMPLHEQYETVCRNDDHTEGMQRFGMKYINQCRMWNDWRKALNDFAQSLPIH